MKKFRLLSAVCALAITMSLGFAGCSGNNASSAADNSDSKTESSVTASDSKEESNTNASDDSLKKVQDAGKLVLGLDATFEPMGYTDENDKIVGFDIDCAEEVCKRMGVTLEPVGINWDTKETDLDLGKFDCIWNGMSVNPSRAEKMNLSDPYMKNAMVFIVNDSSEIKGMDDLKGKKIAVQNGSTAQEILEACEIKDDISVVGLATNVEAMQQLELDVVDAVFLDSVVANYKIAQGKKFKVLPEGLEEEEYAIGFRKNDQALRDEVQKQLSAMKADGKLAEISTKWFGSDVTTVK